MDMHLPISHVIAAPLLTEYLGEKATSIGEAPQGTLP